MSEFTCVGIRNMDFAGSDGKPVKGLQLHLTFQDQNIQGAGVDKVFIPDRNLMNLSYLPAVGERCEILYNKYGKVADIRAV